MDALLDGRDLCPDNRILASKDAEAEPRGRWNTIILLVSDDLEQLCRTIAALRRDNADFVATNRIDGRVTASQIAAASLASFLLRFR